MRLVDFESFLERPNTDGQVLASGICLLNAINDWPDEASTLEKFERAVRDFLGYEPTRSNIALYESNLDLSKDAWYAESLTQVVQSLELFQTSLR